MDVDDSTTTADQEKIEDSAVAAVKVSAQHFLTNDELGLGCVKSVSIL